MPVLFTLALAWAKKQLLPIIIIGAVVAAGLIYHFVAVHNARVAGVEQGKAYERERSVAALEEEIKRWEKSKDAVLKMPDDQRGTLYGCIRNRVRGERTTPDCERLLRDLP